jgi:hypothetical protein
LNKDFNPREIVGDNPEDINDKFYGNNDVVGPSSDHGTSVAGVIAANRNNGYGINGIVDSVRIMVLRTTPRGDERDKDVALAIFYAVDNGADIVERTWHVNARSLFEAENLDGKSNAPLLVKCAEGGKAVTCCFRISISAREPMVFMPVQPSTAEPGNCI